MHSLLPLCRKFCLILLIKINKNDKSRLLFATDSGFSYEFMIESIKKSPNLYYSEITCEETQQFIFPSHFEQTNVFLKKI